MGALRLLTSTEILNKIHDLPTLPSIIYEIRSVIDNPMSSTADVEKVMENDPSFTTKILKLANSAYYAIPGGVTQLSRAVAYLGFDTVHQLVLSASIIDILKVKASPYFHPVDFWKHSLGVAIAAETIAKFVNYPVPADLFTCGLVHDIGKLALFSVAPDLMTAVVDEAHDHHITYREAEERLGLPSHTQIGHQLSAKWKLPLAFQCCVKYHHQKNLEERDGSLTPASHLLIDIVLLANVLCHAMKFGNSGHPVIAGAPKEVLKRLGLEEGFSFTKLLQVINVQMQHGETFLEILEAKA
jgi:HD-like signal output (HDOD) protein